MGQGGAGQHLDGVLAAADARVEVVGAVLPAIHADADIQLPALPAIVDIGECGQVGLVPVADFKGQGEEVHLLFRRQDFARPDAGAGRHADGAPQRPGDVAVGIDPSVPPDLGGTHLFGVQRIVGASQPTEGAIRGRCETQLLGEHIHVFGSVRIEDELFADVGIRVAGAVGGGVGGQRQHGDGVEVQFHFQRAGEGVALVG